ncbi:MAG: hypothetical protein ACKV2V_24355, partial [Blastocatellia bacterium]
AFFAFFRFQRFVCRKLFKTKDDSLTAPGGVDRLANLLSQRKELFFMRIARAHRHWRIACPTSRKHRPADRFVPDNRNSG